jgi:hypothetical protein
MSSTRADRGRSGSLAGLRLCIVMHVGNSGGSRGRAFWAAGQTGESAHPGQQVSAKDGSPNRDARPSPLDVFR